MSIIKEIVPYIIILTTGIIAFMKVKNKADRANEIVENVRITVEKQDHDIKELKDTVNDMKVSMGIIITNQENDSKNIEKISNYIDSLRN